MSQQESKFFNNQGLGKSLFDKIKGIAEYMKEFYEFLAVVGFFRSTGYLKLQNELKDVKKSKYW